MKHHFLCAAFDLDGTLIDTSEGVFSAVVYAVRKNGLRELTDDELHTFIGPPLSFSFKRYYGLDDNKVKEVISDYRSVYNTTEMYKARPYDGIFDVLAYLNENGIKPAVATYKPEVSAKTLLCHFGFDKYTDLMYGADENDILKKKDIIAMAVKAAGVTDMKDAVMIGDSDNDARGALEAGVPFIGVTYGFGFKSYKDVAEFPHVACAGSTYELMDLL